MYQEYLKELAKVALLTKVEEEYLWHEFKNMNSREARQRLIEAYQPLVFKLVVRIAGREELFLDLVQEGTVGLIEAIERYEIERAVLFSTFAQHRIRGRVIDYLNRHRSYHDSLELAIHDEEFESLLNYTKDNKVNVEEEVTFKFLEQQIKKAISKLSPKEQKVICDLYLLDKEPFTSAQEMEISISYFYKLQKKALQRLRGMLSKLRAELKVNGY